MTNTITLKAHLEAENLKTQAWVAEDPDNRFSTTWVTDLSHWAGMGITTVVEFEHYQLVTEAYETHKDVYGFKPSWSYLKEHTTEMLEELIEKLDAAWAHKAQEEAEMKKWEAEEEARLVLEEAEFEKRCDEMMSPHFGFTIGDRI